MEGKSIMEQMHGRLHRKSQSENIHVVELPIPNGKVCKITNDTFSYMMEVDDKIILFNLQSNAEYFASIFEKLGYNVVFDKRQRKNVVYYKSSNDSQPLKHKFECNFPTDEEVIEYFEDNNIKPVKWWREAE